MKCHILPLFILPLIAPAGCSDLIKRLEIENPAAPAKYYETSGATLPIDAKYSKLGPFDVLSTTIPSGEVKFKEYKVWYPESIEGHEARFPVVVFANGSGVKYYRYESVFEHLASWGFVVIGNDDPTSFSGASCSKALSLLTKLNSQGGNKLFGKLDVENAGISGHSQGGVGAIAAATDYPNSSNFKAVFTASTLRRGAATAIKWPYDVTKLQAAYFSVAGTGRNDAGQPGNPNAGIAPLPSLVENFSEAKRSDLKVIARKKNSDHPEMLYAGNSYMIAFFQFILKNNAEAGKAFIGDRPELSANSSWQDVRIEHSR